MINNLEKYIKKEIKQVKYNVTFEKIHYVLIDEYLYKETGNKFAKVFRSRPDHVSSIKQGLLPEWQEILKDGKKNIGLLVISSGSNSKKSFHLLKMPDDLESKIMKSHNDLYLVLLQVLESISASEILGLWYFIKGSHSNEMEIIEDMMSEGI